MSDGNHDTDIARSTLAVGLQPVRISIGPGNARMNWRLVLTNAGDAHIVALRIWSDLTATRFAVPDREDFFGPDTADARLHQIRMLAAGEERVLSGEWQIKRPAFVPFIGLENRLLTLARIRIVGAGVLPVKKLFLVGKEPLQDDAQPEAIACDGALQVHSNLVARPVEPRQPKSEVASETDAA